VTASPLRGATRPTESRPASCGRWSSPIPAVPARAPRDRVALPDHPQPWLISTPMCRTRSPCCVRVANGHAAVAPPSSVTNSRRFHWWKCIRSPAGNGSEDMRLKGISQRPSA